MTRPILVFGASGRVGGEMIKLSTSMRIAPKANGLVFFGPEADITDPQIVHECVAANHGAAAIINLAASTLPHAEKPENEREAWDVNSTAVLHMSSLGVPIVHISTDCVFDGTKEGPYVPGDAVNPLNIYGKSKWRGEEFLMDGPARDIVIRTTGVYLADKPNFLKLVVDKARACEPLTVVEDSIYSPTDARELAKAILVATERVIEDPSVSGTYHFAGPDVMSYLEFANLVQEEAGLMAPIYATTMAEREAIEGFKRPRNASLNSDKFAGVFGLRHRSTRECVRELVQPR